MSLLKLKKNTPPSNESSDAKPKGIKLKEGVYLATNSAAVELCDNHDAPYYTMLCQYVSSTHDPMSCTLHPVVTNLLQEIDDEMESRTTPIQEREDDEDIATLDMHEPASSPSYKSLQHNLHVHLGFSQHPCTVLAISPSYGVRMR